MQLDLAVCWLEVLAIQSHGIGRCGHDCVTGRCVIFKYVDIRLFLKLQKDFVTIAREETNSRGKMYLITLTFFK